MSQDFLNRMKGSFRGMLRWDDLDALWLKVLESPEGWYVSFTGTEPVQETLNIAMLQAFIAEIDELLRREHECDYCGIVFVDDPESPAFIKIHDPNNVGSMCGSSTVRIPPRWVLSRIPPVLIVDEAPLPNNRRHWWQKLFGG